MTDHDHDELLDGFQAALVGRDRAAFAAVCALDVHYEDPLTGPAVHGNDALGDHCAKLWVAVPDARVETAGERLSDGRFLAAPIRLSGTHTGELPGLPPTRRPFSVHAVLYCELDPPRERLWRVRAFFDLYDAAVQVGVLPSHGGVGERALMLLRGFGLRARG
ncbi:MAG TPA: ester cyclase [Baekduia sp.]